jgi:hypothetical protein
MHTDDDALRHRQLCSVHRGAPALTPTFGGSPTYRLGASSEVVVDLANEIACCSGLDTKHLEDPLAPEDATVIQGWVQNKSLTPASPVGSPDPSDTQGTWTHRQLINCFLDTEEQGHPTSCGPLAMHCTDLLNHYATHIVGLEIDSK